MVEVTSDEETTVASHDGGAETKRFLFRLILVGLLFLEIEVSGHDGR